MCDQTEIQYLPDEIVWVKLGPVWWPGKVQDYDSLPEEITGNLRKKPIAIVKFFQEDTYEYIKNLNHIYRYNCLKKNEFIRKGLDMCRSGNSRDVPSNMKMFPEDIVTAEKQTGGDPNILQSDLFAPEEKKNYNDLFGTPKKMSGKESGSGKKGRLSADVKPNVKSLLKTPSSSPHLSQSPRSITHPRFIGRNLSNSPYESRVRQQPPTESESSPPNLYRCHQCDFTTVRLNVIVLHNKHHTGTNADFSCKESEIVIKKSAVKVKSASTPKIKQSEATKRKLPSETPNVPKKANTSQDSAIKESENLSPKVAVTHDVESKPVAKKRLAKPTKSEKLAKIMKENEAIRENLLKDWDDESGEEEEISKQSEDKFDASFNGESRSEEDESGFQSSPVCSKNLNETNDSCELDSNHVQSSEQNDKKTESESNHPQTEKSCFDFDDSEDNVPPENSVKFGRKIPRVISEESVSPAGEKVDEQDEQDELDELKRKVDSFLNDTSAPALPESLKLPNFNSKQLMPSKFLLSDLKLPIKQTITSTVSSTHPENFTEKTDSRCPEKSDATSSESTVDSTSLSKQYQSIHFADQVDSAESSKSMLPENSSPNENLSEASPTHQIDDFPTSSPKPSPVKTAFVENDLTSLCSVSNEKSKSNLNAVSPPKIIDSKLMKDSSENVEKVSVENEKSVIDPISLESNKSSKVSASADSTNESPSTATEVESSKVDSSEKFVFSEEKLTNLPQNTSSALSITKDTASVPVSTSMSGDLSLPVDIEIEIETNVITAKSTVKHPPTNQSQPCSDSQPCASYNSDTNLNSTEVQKSEELESTKEESKSEASEFDSVVDISPSNSSKVTNAESSLSSPQKAVSNTLGFREAESKPKVKVEVTRELVPPKKLKDSNVSSNAESSIISSCVSQPSTGGNASKSEMEDSSSKVAEPVFLIKEASSSAGQLVTENADAKLSTSATDCVMNFDINSMPIIIDNSEYLPNTSSYEKLEPITTVSSLVTVPNAASTSVPKKEIKAVKSKSTVSFLEKALSTSDSSNSSKPNISTPVKKMPVSKLDKGNAPKILTTVQTSGTPPKMRTVKLPTGSKFITQNSKSLTNQVLILKTSTGQQILKSPQLIQQPDGTMLILASNQSKSGVIVKGISKDQQLPTGKITTSRIISTKGIVSSSGTEGASSSKSAASIISKPCAENTPKSKTIIAPNAQASSGATQVVAKQKILSKVPAAASGGSVSIVSPQTSLPSKNVILTSKQGGMPKVIITSKPGGAMGTKFVMHSSPTKIVLPPSMRQKLMSSSTSTASIIVQTTRQSTTSSQGTVSSKVVSSQTSSLSSVPKVVRTQKQGPNILQKQQRKSTVKAMQTLTPLKKSVVTTVAAASPSNPVVPVTSVPSESVILPSTSVGMVPNNPNAVPQAQPVVYVAVDNSTYQAVDSSMLAFDGSQQAAPTLYINSGTTNLENILLTIDEKGNVNLAQQTPQLFTSDVATPTQDILAKALADTQVLQTEASIADATGRVAYIESLPYPAPSLTSNVLETSLTLNQPIMSPLEVPSSATPISSNFNLITTDQSATVAKSSAQDVFLTHIPGVPSSNVAFQITVDESLVASSSAGLSQLTSLTNPLPASSESLETNIDEDLIKINKPLKPTKVKIDKRSHVEQDHVLPDPSASGIGCDRLENQVEFDSALAISETTVTDTDSANKTNFMSLKRTLSEIKAETISNISSDQIQTCEVSNAGKIEDESFDCLKKETMENNCLQQSDVLNGVSTLKSDIAATKITKEQSLVSHELVNKADEISPAVSQDYSQDEQHNL